MNMAEHLILGNQLVIMRALIAMRIDSRRVLGQIDDQRGLYRQISYTEEVLCNLPIP